MEVGRCYGRLYGVGTQAALPLRWGGQGSYKGRFFLSACESTHYIPSPLMGEGQGGGEQGRQAMTARVSWLLPPIPPVPRDCVGGGAPVERRPFLHKGGRGQRPRKARRKSRTERRCPNPLHGSMVMSGTLECPQPGFPTRLSSLWEAWRAAGGTSRTQRPATRRPVRARPRGSAG